MQNPQSRKRSSRPTVVQRAEAVLALPKDDEKALADALRPYLNDRSSRVRWFALDVVKDESVRELEACVIELLTDKSDLIRDSAVECLGTLHEDEGIRVSWLYPLLQDPSWLVRIEAIESLTQIGDNSSRPLIARLLEDDVALVRGYAAVHLVMLGGSRYRKMIEIAARNESEEAAQVRFAAALFELGDEKQFPEVLRFLSSTIYQVRCAAAHMLSDLSLSPSQLEIALTALSNARVNYLYRADQSTMETVEKELLDQQAEATV